MFLYKCTVDIIADGMRFVNNLSPLNRKNMKKCPQKDDVGNYKKSDKSGFSGAERTYFTAF